MAFLYIAVGQDKIPLTPVRGRVLETLTMLMEIDRTNCGIASGAVFEILGDGTPCGIPVAEFGRDRNV